MSDLGRRLIEQGAREERQAIVDAYDAYRRDNLPADAFRLAIESREKESGRIKLFSFPEFTWDKAWERINEIINAVNELREAKK